MLVSMGTAAVALLTPLRLQFSSLLDRIYIGISFLHEMVYEKEKRVLSFGSTPFNFCSMFLQEVI